MKLLLNSSGREARAERLLADVLTRHWSLLTEAEKQLAVESAVDFGLAFAEEWPGEEADRRAYVDVVVWWAYSSVKAINETEVLLWESAPEDDPRILGFRIGCEGYADGEE